MCTEPLYSILILSSVPRAAQVSRAITSLSVFQSTIFRSPMSSVSLSQSSILVALDNLLKSISCSSDSGEPADREHSALQKAEMKVTQLVLAAGAFHKVVNTQLALQLRHRNHLASPILRLPDELISTLFEFVIFSLPRDHDQLENLRCVCHRFYQIADSTPTLWSQIYRNQKRPNLRKAVFQLVKSKEAPLSINIYQLEDLVQQAVLLKLLAQHIHRWKDVRIEFTSRTRFSNPDTGLNALLNLLSGGKAPLLEDFQLLMERSSDLDNPKSDAVNLFQGYAPRLHSLGARYITMSWDNPIISGLTYLSIYAWDGLKTPTSQQYIHLLESCPKLEDLFIVGREDDFFSSEGSIFHLQIHLPFLTHLSLINLHPRTISSITLSVRASLDSFQLSIPASDPDGCREALIALHFGDEQSALSAPQASLHELDMSNNRIDVMTGRKGAYPARLSCFFPNMDVVPALIPPLLNPSHRARVHKLMVWKETFRWLEPELLRQLLEELTELRELRFGEERKAGEILNILSSPVPTSVSGGSSDWLCPQLCKLSIHWWRSKLSVVLDFARSRYQHPSGNPPTKLEELTITNALEQGIFRSSDDAGWEKMESDIRAIVGENSFRSR
ncbi:hypothetical protein FRC03_003587 [Tulasnella sp. 419]|nr:hypothetical protein FRC03_003587 [Tulasnella sp. 419]